METRLKEKIARLTDAQRREVADYIDALLAERENKNLINEPETFYQTSGKKNKKPNLSRTDPEDKGAVIENEGGGKKLKREFGSLKGVITYIADDFDAPLEDFKDYR